MARRKQLRQDRRSFFARKPLGQYPPFGQILLADLRARDRRNACAGRLRVDFDVGVGIREVDQFVEWYRGDADLLSVFRHQRLRVVWAIERLTGAIVTRPGMIAPDDEVRRTEVAANDRMPER